MVCLRLDLRNRISGDGRRYCSLNAQQFSVFGWVQGWSWEIPRNPTVVLFSEKFPRVLCSHPLTGGPGFLFLAPPP